MISRFNDDKIDIVVRTRINKRTLKPNESVNTYFNELKREADKIQMSEEAFLFAFIQGLPVEMKKQILVQNPETIEAALNKDVRTSRQSRTEIWPGRNERNSKRCKNCCCGNARSKRISRNERNNQRNGANNDRVTKSCGKVW